jgi:hypothetical protein
MAKQLENPGKKEKGKAAQPAQLSPARPRAHAPAPPDRWDPHVSGNSFPRTLLSLSLPSGAKLSAPVFSPAHPSSLSALRAHFASRRAVAPCACSLSRCAVGLPYQLHPPRAHRGQARAHSRTSLESSAMTPAHVPNSLFAPRPRPHSLPRLISRSPAPTRALPTPSDLAGDPRPPPRSSSSPEATPSDPELHPEVRHPPPCLFYSIRACP